LDAIPLVCDLAKEVDVVLDNLSVYIVRGAVEEEPDFLSAVLFIEVASEFTKGKPSLIIFITFKDVEYLTNSDTVTLFHLRISSDLGMHRLK